MDEEKEYKTDLEQQGQVSRTVVREPREKSIAAQLWSELIFHWVGFHLAIHVVHGSVTKVRGDVIIPQSPHFFLNHHDDEQPRSDDAHTFHSLSLAAQFDLWADPASDSAAARHPTVPNSAASASNDPDSRIRELEAALAASQSEVADLCSASGPRIRRPRYTSKVTMGQLRTSLGLGKTAMTHVCWKLGWLVRKHADFSIQDSEFVNSEWVASDN
ncbi:hypothetical protein DFH08DRAFT_817062 [Mycena albidolilacea]|uniref:Uncharacterized protein n=1 Tax=Mycena albidolilacea TaxID=1033008 RepID=A0AAD7EHS2_9AGAR|nr:hypothetical protein DFH08DRAFT_817062 [Mycena albidolilacea]